jgi:PhzF family phenazine biosynthesis protein
MALEIYQVDSFTEKPFAGNPAGVVPLAAPASPTWMQSFAAEMNLSETAYFWPEGDAFRLRWFTPAVEARLCGHATLASAHTLWESGRLDSAEPARFDTLSGRLTCARRSDGAIEMEFPARRNEPIEPPPGLLAALGLDSAPDSKHPALFVGRNVDDYLVEVATADEVRRLAPDVAALRKVGARGVIVTAPSDRRAGGHPCDFVSRFFAPGAGIDEDPVTGSAHCALAPFWSARLGRTELVGYQMSARGGTVRVKVAGDRVLLTGRAVTIFRAELSRRVADLALPA